MTGLCITFGKHVVQRAPHSSHTPDGCAVYWPSMAARTKAMFLNTCQLKTILEKADDQ